MHAVVIYAGDLALGKAVCDVMKTKGFKARYVDFRVFSGEIEHGHPTPVLMTTKEDAEHPRAHSVLATLGCKWVQVPDEDADPKSLAKTVSLIAAEEAAKQPEPELSGLEEVVENSAKPKASAKGGKKGGKKSEHEDAPPTDPGDQGAAE